MTHSLITLLKLKARVGEDRFPVRALFHGSDDRTLKNVAIDTGGWLDRHEILVAIERFGAPGDDDWPLEMTGDELEAAPVWEGGQDHGWALPPVVVGPLGYTFSPVMMAAGLHASADQSFPAPPEGRADLVSESGGRLAGLERCSDWLGLEAFGPGGSLGRIDDLIYDRDYVLTAVRVEDGTEMPMARLRNIAEQGHLVFD